MMKRKKQIILVAIILLLAIITVIGCFFLNENTSINQFKGTSNNSNAGVTRAATITLSPNAGQGRPEIYLGTDKKLYLDTDCTAAYEMTSTKNNIVPPTRTGYKFKGYGLGESGALIINENGYALPDIGNILYQSGVKKLTAQWEEKVTQYATISLSPTEDAISITLNHNGGAGWDSLVNLVLKKTGTDSGYYFELNGKKLSLTNTVPPPQWPGHTFKGYCFGAFQVIAEDGLVYINQDTFDSVARGLIKGDKTLIAQWETNVTSVSINPSYVTIIEGKTAKLSTTVLPTDATNRNVTYTSSNPEVATVSSTGVVTGVKEGTARITATAVANNGIKGNCEVTVIPPTVTGITIKNPKTDYKQGENLDLSVGKITVSYNNDTTRDINLSDSGVSISGYDKTKIGNQEITVSYGDKQAKFTVTVSSILVTGISLDKTEAEIEVGNTVTLKASVNPDNATNKNVTYTSENEGIATVSGIDDEGKVTVTGHKAGEVTITATTQDGSNKTASCKIKVKQLATGISLDKTEAEIEVGDTVELSARIEPEETTNKNIKYTSENEEIATVGEVNSEGKVTVTGHKAGEVTITVTTQDGSNKTATCKITVKQPATGISLDKTEAEIEVGDTVTLEARIEPEDTTNTNVTYTSSDEEIATVSGIDDEGKVTVTGHKAGEVTITVTTQDGSNKTATCKITVKQPATGISLDKTEAEIEVGNTVTLEARIEPEDTTNANVTYTSSDEEIATVSEIDDEGKVTVTGHKAGEVTITVTTQDGSNKTATCKITVKQPATGISLDKTEAEIEVGDTVTLEARVEPEDTTNTNVTYTSSDEEIATVSEIDEEGKVTITGHKAGEVTITVTTQDGSNKTATCKIIIKDTKPPVIEKVEEDKNILYITAADAESEVKKVTVNGIDITSQKTEDGRYYFKLEQSGEYEITIEDVNGNIVTKKLEWKKEDEPGEDKPGEDKPGEDKPGEDKPGEDNPGEDNPGGSNPGGSNPGGSNPGGSNPGGSNSGGSNSGGSNSTGNNSNEKNNNNSTKQVGTSGKNSLDATTSSNTLPKAGYTIGVFIGIIIIVVIGVISIVKYKNIDLK